MRTFRGGKPPSERSRGAHTADTFHQQHIRSPPRPQMKEESPCAGNALRTALRIYNKRRIIDTGALKSNPQAVTHRQINMNTLKLPLKLQNTHYSVLLRCLHRHLEQNRTGCLLWEQRQPCRGAWCVSVVALTQEDIPVPAPYSWVPPLHVRLGLAESTSPLHRLPEMGGYLLTYAL